MYLSEVQIQMVDIAAYHCVEGDSAPFVVKPIVVELVFVNRADYVADVLVIVFQQQHELMPVLVLIVLKLNPKVVVLGVVRKYEHTHLGVGH